MMQAKALNVGLGKIYRVGESIVFTVCYKKGMDSHVATLLRMTFGENENKLFTLSVARRMTLGEHLNYCNNFIKSQP